MFNTGKSQYLYLMKEPCSLVVKILLWIISLLIGIILHLRSGSNLCVLFGVLGGIPLWIISESFMGYFKVGITKNLDRRLTEVNNGNARNIYYAANRRRNDAAEKEKEIHRKYSKQRKDGEWFGLYFWQVWWLRIRYY